MFLRARNGCEVECRMAKKKVNARPRAIDGGVRRSASKRTSSPTREQAAGLAFVKKRAGATGYRVLVQLGIENHFGTDLEYGQESDTHANTEHFDPDAALTFVDGRIIDAGVLAELVEKGLLEDTYAPHGEFRLLLPGPVLSFVFGHDGFERPAKHEACGKWSWVCECDDVEFERPF